MRNKRKTNHGKPIKGSDLPFKGSDLVTAFNSLINYSGDINLNELDAYRNMCKDAIATLAKVALLERRRVITPDCKFIINQHLTEKSANPHVAGFICCTIDYFNDERTHIAGLNLHCANCRSKRKKKAIQHFSQDSKYMINHYVKPIINSMQKCKWANVNPNINKEIIDEYSAIIDAVNFWRDYIREFYCEELPMSITPNIYNVDCSYGMNNNSIEELNTIYSHYNEISNMYYRTAGPKSYYALDSLCATYIACNTIYP